MESVTALSSLPPAADRSLPVHEPLTPLLPVGLQRRWIVGCTGSAAMSLALAVAGRAVSEGSWLAAVGVPALGVEAAAELGVPLSRLVAVDAGTGPTTWAERIGAALDGFELILTQAPPGAERMARQIRHRLQAKGAVLLVVSHAAPTVGCDLELTSGEVRWVGLGAGHGHLVARRVSVRAGGRRMPGVARCDLWLPGPDGRLAVAETSETAIAATSDETAGLRRVVA